jgi:O-succinylbenzoic acid--CoA ligase
MCGVTKLLAPLPIPTGTDVLSVASALERALNGVGPALLPVTAGDSRESDRLLAALGPGEPIDDAVAVVVATSGTTGTPKGALLTSDALRASISGTYQRLGGEGSWLLALPAQHIAGLQVLLRSIAIGTLPLALDVSNGFSPSEFAKLAARRTALSRRYTALVPGQLVKILADANATAALADFDGVLVGGAATAAHVLDAAREAGIKIFTTYGSSETCGGAVYNGIPLPNAKIRIEGKDSAEVLDGGVGRVLLGGPMVALGYRNRPEHPAFAEPGWFRADDAGVLEAGVLRIVGRLDEGISTGGLTVIPQVVERALAGHPAVADCAVFGLPDARLGEQVAVAVVPADPAAPPSLQSLREFASATLDSTACPRTLIVLEALPLRGPGKVDRAAVRAAARESRPDARIPQLPYNS